MAQHGVTNQWQLTRNETITSFEHWRQNLIHVLTLDPLFAPFLADGTTWQRKTAGNRNRGLQDDVAPVPAEYRRTAVEKNASLDVMLGQIANACPVIARIAIVKQSTSVNSIWEQIRLHFGFESCLIEELNMSDTCGIHSFQLDARVGDKLNVDPPASSFLMERNDSAIPVPLKLEEAASFLLTVEAIQPPQPRDEATSSHQSLDEATPSPQSLDGATSLLQSLDEATPSPPSLNEAISSPQSRDEATSPPQSRDEVTPPPQSRDEATPPPHSRDEATPLPQSLDEAPSAPQLLDTTTSSLQSLDDAIRLQLFDKSLSPQMHQAGHHALALSDNSARAGIRSPRVSVVYHRAYWTYKSERHLREVTSALVDGDPGISVVAVFRSHRNRTL